MPATTGDLLTTQEAARLLGVTVRQFHYLVERGDLAPAMKAPGKRGAYFFDAATVEALAGAA